MPRFHVRVTRGYLEPTSTREITEVCVHDSLNCWETVWSSLDKYRPFNPGSLSAANKRPDRDRKEARMIAAMLERDFG